MATSGTIDLSLVPSPDVVEALDFETIRSECIAALTDALPALAPVLALESEPLVKLVEIFAYRELAIRSRVNQAARAVMPAYAVGADLDNLAVLLSVQRLLITPADPSQNLAAIYEDDDALRRRLVLAPAGFSVAGPADSYQFHALSADPDVLDAGVTSPAPGQVLVSVLSRVGDGTASAELLAAVSATLDGDTVRPLTDQVTVAAAAIVDFVVTAQIYTLDGPDPSVVVAASLAQLAIYLESCRRVGRDITRSGLFAALHGGGVQRVDLSAPAADVVISDLQAGWCTATNITWGGVAD